MSELFAASSNFSDCTPTQNRNDRYNPSLKEKIEVWLERAAMHPEYLDYDPSDYSVEEWEAYLVKKNNRLTFAQFLRRPRWILQRHVWGNLDSLRTKVDAFRDKLRKAQEKADKFLSEAQLEYVDVLLDKICSKRKEYEEAMANVQRTRAATLLRELRFMCKFKITLGHPLPECVHEDIIERLMEHIAYRKWCLRKKGCEAYDPEKCPTFQIITRYSLFTPEEIDRAMQL